MSLPPGSVLTSCASRRAPARCCTCTLGATAVSARPGLRRARPRAGRRPARRGLARGRARRRRGGAAEEQAADSREHHPHHARRARVAAHLAVCRAPPRAGATEECLRLVEAGEAALSCFENRSKAKEAIREEAARAIKDTASDWDVLDGEVDEFGRGIVIKQFSAVTVLFADIVDFSAMTREHPPSTVVRILASLFGSWDHLCLVTRCWKLKTVGDAFVRNKVYDSLVADAHHQIAVSGMPFVGEEDRAVRCAELALTMLEEKDAVARELGVDIRVRVGVHDGPVIAGLISRGQAFFDIWGGS